MASTVINPNYVIQVLNLPENCLKFQVPFAMSISGPSQSGKTSFMCNLIENRDKMFTASFERIILCQHENLSFRHNETFERLRKTFPIIELVSGLPNISKLKLDMNPSVATLLLIDDLQTEFLESQDMLHLLSVSVHHFNISVCYTLQNFFAPSRFGKSLSRNVNYKVFFYNRLDLTELRHISLQITPNNSTFLQSCFNFLLSQFPNDRHYILVDGHFHSPTPQLFVRSNIFPKEETGEIEPIIFFSSV